MVSFIVYFALVCFAPAVLAIFALALQSVMVRPVRAFLCHDTRRIGRGLRGAPRGSLRGAIYGAALRGVPRSAGGVALRWAWARVRAATVRLVAHVRAATVPLRIEARIAWLDTLRVVRTYASAWAEVYAYRTGGRGAFMRVAVAVSPIDALRGAVRARVLIARDDAALRELVTG